MDIQKKIRQWWAHFFFINLIIVYLCAAQYLHLLFPIKIYYFEQETFHTVNALTKLILAVYLLTSYLSYFALLTWLSLLPAGLLSHFFKKIWVIMSFSILGIVGLLLFLMVDAQVFHLYRFHLNEMVFKIIMSAYRADTYYFSQAEWQRFYSIVLLVVILEIAVALFLWFKPYFNISKWIHITLYGVMAPLLLISCISAWHHPFLIQQSNIFPYYDHLIGYLFHISPVKMNHVASSHYFFQSKYPKRTLDYPLKALQCSPPAKPLNVFIILVDTWRFDAMSREITPHLADFAAQNLRFHHHLSGGNATQPGVFTFFYGLPGTYWTAMLEQKRNPALIQQFIQAGYQSAMFSSTSLKIPNIESTVFQLTPLFYAPPAEAIWQKDSAVTKQFIQFLSNNSSQRPIFSFIFYDSVHDYCGQRNYHGPFYPELAQCNRHELNNDYDKTPFLNRYLNSVHFVDQQIAEVLESIRKAQLWDNSVIIISGDHGEEFNDNQLNYWGHASNFTQYQLQVPLLIHWPGKPNQNYFHTTTHYDITPTLLTDVLRCRNPATDYSEGTRLFDSKDRYPIIVSNNYNAGYLTPHTIVNLFLSGDIEVRDPRAQLLNEKPQTEQFEFVLKRLDRFYLK